MKQQQWRNLTWAELPDGSYWFSNRRMTVSVDVDADKIITDAAPIARKFVGQPLRNLAIWMGQMK